VTGVVGVTAPLCFPDVQLGESVSIDDANDGRRPLMSYDEEPKLSVNDGHSRGEDNGEYRSRSVSKVGRCVSNVDSIVAMSRYTSDPGPDGYARWTLQELDLGYATLNTGVGTTMTM
jgi:hypothetical protein